MGIAREALQALIEGHHGQPFQLLGPHALSGAAPKVEIRTFQPDARAVAIHDGPTGKLLAEATLLDPAGLFVATLDRGTPEAPYRIVFETLAGEKVDLHDPYQFESSLGELDQYLFREGTDRKLWEKLGAHPKRVRGVAGVHFAVWAPNARRASVVGDFNTWDGRRHPMRKHEATGIFELFIPGLQVGEAYKYEILPAKGDWVQLKADPLGFSAEVPPKTASRIFELSGFEWHDAEWLERRARSNYLTAPISIYEVHLGSWRRVPEEGNRSLSYREAAEQLAAYVTELGYTHVELLPISEHPFYASWGYQPVGFFAPTARYGDPHELMAFVDILHAHGIGVILDWVPAHFPTDAHGLARFDGTHLYEHADPRQGRHPDWGTLVFNYGRTEIENFLISNALYWLEVFHIDGLRVDAVASMLYLDYSRKPGDWVPNKYGGNENLEAIAFLKQLNTVLNEVHPGILTIAEESTSFSGVSRPTYVGGLGFSLKWNMGWMHDTLDFFSKDPIYRRFHSNKLTFAMLYAYSENFTLALSHDEVVHGKGSLLNKMPGDPWQKRANLRALFGFMFGFPGKKLHFMGGEFGQWREWNHDSSLDWHLLADPGHRGILHWMKDLNALYRREPALHERDFDSGGFSWIDCTDVDRLVYSFIRFAQDRDERVVVVCNLTPIPRERYRVGLPGPGHYRELLNSDAAFYGGGNIGNAGAIEAEALAWHGQSHSAELTLPPLGVLFLKADRPG